MNIKMNRNTLALAAIFATLPLFGMAQSPASAALAPAARSQAADMVSANARLMHDLNAEKDHTGSVVRAQLNTTIHLVNGTELKSGTILSGHIVQDQMDRMQATGETSRLTFDFNQARLKDGKTIAIKATLVGISPSGESSTGYLVEPGSKWTKGPLQIDQPEVVPGVALHSQIASSNSGVLVSHEKSNVKLREGTNLQFAIGAASPGEASSS